MGVLHIRDASTKKFVPITTINGITPHIGENKNWWIGDTDTGIRAQGVATSEGGGTVTGIKIGETIYEPDVNGTIELSDMEFGSGDGTVKSINGVEADEYGEVSLCLSDVKPDDNSAADGEVVFIPVKSDDSNKLGGVEADKYALKTDTATNAKKLGGKAPEYYLQPVNLLDNSDFEVAGSGKHGFARWDATNDCTFVVNDGVKTLTSTDGYTYIYQTVFADGRDIGKQYTLAITLEDGTRLAKSGNAPSPHESSQLTFCGIGLGSNVEAFLLKEPNGALRVRLDTKSTGASISFRELDLFEGSYTTETVPPHTPKGYANELLACEVAEKDNIFGMDLLWENASPNSNFADQTIQVSSVGYDMFVIVSSHNNTIAQKGYGFTIPYANNVYVGGREGAVNDSTTIRFRDTFLHGTSGSVSTFNDFCRPLKIYGIKGVGA